MLLLSWLQVIDQYVEVLTDLHATPGLRGVFVKSTGKFFSAGGDLRWMKNSVNLSRVGASQATGRKGGGGEAKKKGEKKEERKKEGRKEQRKEQRKERKKKRKERKRSVRECEGKCVMPTLSHAHCSPDGRKKTWRMRSSSLGCCISSTHFHVPRLHLCKAPPLVAVLVLSAAATLPSA